MMRALIALGVISSAHAFMAPTTVSPRVSALSAEPFSSATEKYKTEFPEFSSYGWGVSTKAERWNGRHAMFGWVFIIATGYAQSHGLIPDGDKLLDIKQWGTLAEITPRVSTITNERAVILVANIHALMVSLCAAFCPLDYQDKLLLEPGEVDEEPAGMFPVFEAGVTPSAEMYNGRMAMLGIVVTSAYSLIYQVPFLKVVDQMLGGMLL